MIRTPKIKRFQILFAISFVLFIIPFFWLKPGEMDLGGDNARIYFYDPASFIKFFAFYEAAAIGKGFINPSYIYLPFAGMLAFLKLFMSSTALISFINGLKLSVGFAAMYLIVFELLSSVNIHNKRTSLCFAALVSGLFYVISFGSINMSYFWDRSLITHNQIFLNPLMFYLLLKFFLGSKNIYLYLAILISLIFAPNFGLIAGPPFFAFYPLSLLFLIIYVRLFSHSAIPWKKFIAGILLFFGIHAFHLLGEGMSLFDIGSSSATRFFNRNEYHAGGADYFAAISGQGKAILNILLPSGKRYLQVFSLFPALIVFISFFINNTVAKKYLLLTTFFLITLFFTSANFTGIGFEFYKKLFLIPGFSMFRNFFTQWLYVHIFFYSLLFGFASFSLLSKLKLYYARASFRLIIIMILLSGMPLLSGEFINKAIIWGSSNVKAIITMDHRYEETLRFIQTLPDDGKILVLPLTDFFRQLVSGTNGGVYEGPSTLPFLTYKYSFVGYQDLGYLDSDPAPYAELIRKYSREKNYNRLLSIFTTLNIRYIFHNTDLKIYEENFYPGGDYSYMRDSMPKTQEEYKDFIKHFPVHEIYRNGPYVIYEMDQSAYNSTIFIPDGVYLSSTLSFDSDNVHSVFIDKNICDQMEFRQICSTGYKRPPVKISFSMINPTKYLVTVRNYDQRSPLFLVMQHTFHTGWKLVLENKVIGGQNHVPVNGYANGWLLSGKDLPPLSDFSFIIQLDPQKYLWYGSTVSVIFLMILIVLLIKSLRSKHERN